MNRIVHASFLMIFALASCGTKETKPVEDQLKSSNTLEGKYLSDSVYFPNDTLVLKPFFAG